VTEKKCVKWVKIELSVCSLAIGHSESPLLNDLELTPGGLPQMSI